jgi:hypothetical protein
MKAGALHLRIRRLVLESPAPDGVTPDALGEAVRRQLAAQMGRAADPPLVMPQSRSLAPLAGSIAAGVTARLTETIPGNQP